MNIRAVPERLGHGFVARHVSQHAQLYLTVIRVNEKHSFPCAEEFAKLAPKLRADGNVLQIRLD